MSVLCFFCACKCNFDVASCSVVHSSGVFVDPRLHTSRKVSGPAGISPCFIMKSRL